MLAVLAVSVFWGWAFHVSALMSVVPGRATMMPNTAAAFLIAGLALLRRDHRDRLCYAFLVLAIAAATLAEYSLKLDIGVDQLLFRDPYSAIHPGRMSPITCVGLILLGPALALMKGKTGRARRISRCLALIAGALGTIALLGYSYDAQALYHVRSYTSVALNTAMAFVIAGIGVQAATPAEGILRHIRAGSAGGAMLRQLLPAALLIPYVLGLAAWIAVRRLGWEVGFALALLVAATMSCLVVVMLLNAKRLEREDLARREVNRALEERTALLQAREELLQHTSDELQRVMASISDYLWSAELDEQGRWNYLYYSPVVERITGRPPSFYLQDPGRWLETIHPDDRSRLVGAFHRVTIGESEREEEEYRILLPNGEIRWVRDCATVTRSGQRLRINGVVSDITERKQEELELRKFISLAENSGEFIGICDLNLIPFYVNQAALQLVGLDSMEQALRTPVPEFFFPEDQRFITEQLFPRVLREGRAEAEVRFRHFKTGAALWMIYNVFQIMGESGQPGGYATVSRDITARKLAEEALRRSEERLRLAQRAAHAGTWEWDLRTNENCWSDELWPLYGLEPHSRAPSYGAWLDTIHPDDRDSVDRAVQSAAAAGAELNLEWRVHRREKGGGERWLLARGEPQLDAGGKVIRYVGIVLDITDRKQAENALRNSERQLRVLTGSLLTAQEDERRRLSRELHDDITQQLAFLSIELGKLALEFPSTLRGVQAKIRELQQHTQDTSAEVRRLSHGLHPSVIEDFGLEVALEEFCSEFQKAKGIHVRFQGRIEDARLDDASAACLYRVAQEALRNAVTHGQATEVRVTLRREPESVQLRVTDNGGGFPPEGIGAKAGLGLVSMRERVRLAHGTLRLCSRPGKGAEVVATVPLVGVGHEENADSRR